METANANLAMTLTHLREALYQPHDENGKVEIKVSFDDCNMYLAVRKDSNSGGGNRSHALQGNLDS